MIRKLLLALGIVLFGLGIKECADTFSFTASAVPVKSVVVSVEERKGPPKPTQNTPVHVRFTLPDGSEHAAITHLPLLAKIKTGDEIIVLVQPSNPQIVLLPLLSELWARPLAYLLSGFALIVALVVLKGGLRRDWAPPAK
jgi:hypothetical protein